MSDSVLHHFTARGRRKRRRNADVGNNRGFAATGPAKAFELAGTMAQGFDPTIEEDQVVSING
jgi:hypothetical protein